MAEKAAVLFFSLCVCLNSDSTVLRRLTARTKRSRSAFSALARWALSWSAERLKVIASRSGRLCVGRISGIGGIVDFDTVLLVPNLLIESGGHAIAIGDQASQDWDAPF